MKTNKLLEAVNTTNQRLAKARAKIEKTRLGARIKSRDELNAAAWAKRSVVCPHRGSIYPAAWVLNMNYSTVCNMIETGLFIYTPNGGSR